jgi:transcription elongation factor SPT5
MNGGAEGGMGMRGPRGPRMQDSLIGKIVVIRQGPMLGHRGRVRDATEKTVKINLLDNPRTISVQRTAIAEYVR